MASIQTHGPKKNRYRVRYYYRRKHRAISLPKVTKKQALSVANKIEDLIAAKLSGERLPEPILQWLSKVDEQIHAKLVAAGLTPPRVEIATNTTLGEFLDRYISEQRSSPKTVANLKRSQRKLLEFFSPDILPEGITAGDADRFVRSLTDADATNELVKRNAKQFFKAIHRHKLTSENPFEDIKVGAMKNEDRQVYIPVESIASLIEFLDEANDTREKASVTTIELELIVALARFAGLRVPSEIFALRWKDIGEDRFKVTAPKTKKSRPFRWVPIFPALLPFLDAARELTCDGPDSHVIRNRTRETIRRRIADARELAGLDEWPKLFVNMRSSCETDLIESGFASHIVCDWLGHTHSVAVEHYRQITEKDFERATSNEAPVIDVKPARKRLS